jgi:hypothetical protein
MYRVSLNTSRGARGVITRFRWDRFFSCRAEPSRQSLSIIAFGGPKTPVTLDIYPGNFAPSTMSAKSPEAYATSDPTVDVMPIIPLLPSLLAPVRQAPVGSR